MSVQGGSGRRKRISRRQQSMARRSKLAALFGAALALAVGLVAQNAQHVDPPLMESPLPEKPGPLRKAQLLLREGKTAEARQELERLRPSYPKDADLLYQIAR